MRLYQASACLLFASQLQSTACSSDVQSTIVSATGEQQQQQQQQQQGEASSVYESLKEAKKNVSSSASAAAASAAAAASSIDHGKAMIDWIRAHGGFVHESLYIGPITSDDSLSSIGEGKVEHSYNNTPYGLFTRDTLPVGTTILQIPYELTIHTHADKDFDQCETARKLHKELIKGADSFYAPYVQYLSETQTKGQVPTLWSAAGNQLLKDLLRHNDNDETIALPPYDVSSWEYLDVCQASPEEEFALELLRYRGWDEVLVPVYDMMSHSNDPNVMNTASSKIMRNLDKEPIVVKTVLEVSAKSQLYCSYNDYTGSQNLNEWYGTPGLLIDFGFVESLPQRWFFDQDRWNAEGFLDEDNYFEEHAAINFELSKSTVNGEVVVTWMHEDLREIDVLFAREALEHLKSFGSMRLQSRPEGVLEREFNMIKEYGAAMQFALETALYQHFYDPLLFGSADTYSNINEELYSEDRHYTCDHIQSHSFHGHETLEKVVSHYQRLEFDVHPETRETCFWLDMYVQQCTSYRPHYHEVAIHYTARYLDKVQRIAWIGGGDSMLLHDALKYPTLELALGLELDQKVTRYNYKYMGSQPHYDNDKVQWWYGDATKSLLMLPESYFGSFDMVVIDLSDTAMQLSVTSDLSIFAALSLLLRPGGIMVKNEEYLEQFSRVFDYTLQAHFYDVPIVCSQSFILGSYGTDFLATKPKDHEPSDLMFVNQRPDIQSDFGIWHDYRRNITRTNAHCRDDGEDATASPVEQTTSPGILMVVEAENVTANLASTMAVKELLVTALERDAKMIVTDAVVQEGSGVIGLALRTGYVIARMYPKYNYCALDIHFWSSFELQESVKKVLIDALGGGIVPKSVSSYRIVAGGMFGVDTWKDDAKKQGPRKVHDCQRQQESLRGPFTDQHNVDLIMKEMLSSLVSNEAKNMDVLVVCGAAGADCKTANTLKTISTVGQVHELRACDSLGDYMSMEICEMQTFTSLDKFAKASVEFEGFRALIIDPEAPLEIMQIVLNLFKTGNIWKYTKQEGFLILANSLDPTLSARRAFLDRFRRETTDPAFRAEVLFNSTDSSMEAGLFLYGVADAVDKVTKVVAKIEADTGLVSEMRNIAGGMFRYQYDFDPAQVYKHSDFDMTDVLAQWQSQRPTGFQSIFQFVKLTPEEQLDVHDKVMIFYPADEQWYPGKVVWVHPADDTVDVRYDSGDIGKGVSSRLIKKDASDTAASKDASSKNTDMITAEGIRDALQFALTETNFEGMEEAKVHHYVGPGEGSLTMAFWSGGNAVALWDGRSHIDVNLFTYTESVTVADSVQELFKKRIPFLKTALRDEQPRGYGRVVNYMRDVEEYKDDVPVWALHFSDKAETSME
ncbi:hypothetical protein MPSEU_000748500 [Mayamaea pseudoterrestris]|nr:hypothetical protein MPSEU_000748500 [Mayamaea pseudoterrestris]